MNVNKGLLAILATAALAAAKNKKDGSSGRTSELAMGRSGDVFTYYGFNLEKIGGDFLISPVLASMGTTLGFDQQTIEAIRLYEEDLKIGQADPNFTQEYDDFQNTLLEVLSKRFFVAEMSYYLEHDVPIVSEFIRLNLKGSEPFLKGSEIVKGKRGKSQTTRRMIKGGGLLDEQIDDYLPVYQRLPRQVESQAGQQELFKSILTAPYNQRTTYDRSGYLDDLMGQMGNLINVKITQLIMEPKEQVAHLGDANFENPTDFFSTKSLFFRRLKNYLVEAKKTAKKQFSYLSMINADGTGNFYRATAETYKINTYRKNFQTFVIATSDFQNRQLDYVQIPDLILSGIAANKSQWGVLEKIRYGNDYVRNPHAFSLYVRSILGLSQTLTMGGAKSSALESIDVYALDPRVGDFTQGISAIELNTDPFRFDPVTGQVSLGIMQWAENSVQKMIFLKTELFDKKNEITAKQNQDNVHFYASQVQETISSFVDISLYNKIILSWKRAGNKVTSEVLDDLHLLVIGFLYRINRNFYEAGETPLTISAICDVYCNPLLPFGTATVDSYKQALKMCISGIGVPVYETSDCNEEGYTTDGLGFLVDKVCYDVSISNTMLYLVSEETIADARSLTPYFTYRFFEQGSCLLSYKGLAGQQTVLMHKSFILTPKEGIIPVQRGAAIAVAPQNITADLTNYNLYFSLVNAYNITKTQWTSEKVFGYHMDVGAKPYFKKEDFSLLGTRLRILGYWFSRTCIHLYRTLKSSQRSLSWYLMSTILSPDAIDIGVEKYVNEGLIDPQIFPQIAGRMLEDKSWEELSQNRYFDSVTTFKKIQATLRMILKRLSSYTQMQVRNFTKFNFHPIDGNPAQQAWGEFISKFMIVSGGILSEEKVSSLGIDIGDGYFLSLNKSKISDKESTKTDFINVSTKIFKRRGLVVNFLLGATVEQKLDVCINQANEIIKLGAKANKILVDIIFNIEKSSSFVSILHKDSIALLPKVILGEDGEPLAGYQPVFFGRSFRKPYISFSGLDKNSQPKFDGLVAVWEDGRIVQQVKVAGQQAPNKQCEMRFRVKTPEGTLLAGQLFGMYGENEKNFAAHFADAKDDFRNLSLVNALFTDVAKRMGYVDNGDHNDPKNINALTLEQLLRAIGFYGDPSVDLEQIIASVSESKEVVEDQVISFFKLNKVPFVKGSSLQAYKSFLREANGKPVHEAEQALKNLAVTIGIPLFPYIAISDDRDIHENNYIYGQYNLTKQQKTVFNNYNNEYVPIVANQNNEFSQDSFSRGMRQEKTAYAQLQKVQTDYHTFKEGINILSCQVYYHTLAELMRQMGQTQLDSFGAVGDNNMPLYLKVREQKGGALGILSDDPMGFATMYQVLAEHGQILEAGDRTIVKKVANPSKVLANSLASGDMDLDAEQLSMISALLSNSNFKNIAQYPIWDDKDEVVDWNGIDSKIDRVIIEIAGPLSNHQSKISQANKWSKSANEIDKGKAKAYWDKYERLARHVLENKDSLQSLLDLKDLMSSKLPEVDLEVFDWKGLVAYPNALVKFRNYILEDIKGFMTFPGEVSDQVFSQQAASYQQALARKSMTHEQAFRRILEQQASKNNGMGIRNQAYKSRLSKIYDSYLDAFKYSVVRMESDRLGPLAFITPSGYRVYTPLTYENLKWVSRSSVPRDHRTSWSGLGVDTSIAHYTGKLPANIVPEPAPGRTQICIGWGGQSGYRTQLANGTMIHFVAIDPAGKFTMLMTFKVDRANGSWHLSQAVDRLDKFWLVQNYANLNSQAEKENAIKLSREFLSGVREWAKNPTSEGPEELSRSWKQESDLLWKKSVPKYIGTDAQIAAGDTPMLNQGSSYFAGLSTAEAMGIPYTTSTDGSIKK